MSISSQLELKVAKKVLKAYIFPSQGNIICVFHTQLHKPLTLVAFTIKLEICMLFRPKARRHCANFQLSNTLVRFFCEKLQLNNRRLYSFYCDLDSMYNIFS